MTVSVWILGDQLIPEHPALEEAKRQNGVKEISVLMVESTARSHRRHYNPLKLVLLFSAMRHYAEDLRLQGFRVDYKIAINMTEAIGAHIEAYHPDSFYVMDASSMGGQRYQAEIPQRFSIPVKRIPNSMFLSTRFDPFPKAGPEDQIRQETFYREMRRHFGVLMDHKGEPLGGQWNFDQQNRKKLPGDLHIPGRIRFEPDRITQEVIQSVQERFPWADAPIAFDLAVTHAQAEQAAQDFFRQRLKHFGSYEDAMKQDQELLFHSMLSPSLNLGLLNPLDLAQKAESLFRSGDVAINNVEGFIRQVIGWREYIHWQYQRLMPDLAELNYFDAHKPIPAFFWTGETKMNCLKHVLGRALKEGYAHHIERLMVLSNFCLLAGVEPQAVLDWFQSVFIDAYDWVMLPNVLGMGLYADGGNVGTKPYIASANYIHNMGDYCQNCRYDHNQRTGEGACPFNFLYWNFLLKHEGKLRENHRMARMLYNLKHLDEAERSRVFETVESLFDELFS